MKENTISHTNAGEAEIRTCAQNGQSLRETDSSSEFNKVSGELNQRITQVMGDDFMSTVSYETERAINEAISDQILPQIQATLRAGQGQLPERRWEVPVRGQGFRSEEALNHRFRSNSRDEFPRFPNRNEDLESTHDSCCIEYPFLASI